MLLALGLVGSPAVSGADCSATCQVNACTFDGILNTPLGNAVLSVDQCRLLIGGIGGSGQDGVVQSGLNSKYMVTTLATPNLSGSGVGTEAVIRQVGVVDGRPGSEISVTRILNFSGAQIRLEMDCALIAVEAYGIKVYDEAGLVFSQEPGPDPPILIFPRADVVSMACGLLPKGDLYTAVSFLQPTPFTIQTSRGNLGPYTGTCLRLTGYAPAHVPTSQDAIENRFRNTGMLPIVELFAGALPHGEPRSAQARSPRRCGLPEER